MSGALAQEFRHALTACMHQLMQDADQIDTVRSAAKLLGASVADLFRGFPQALEKTQHEFLTYLCNHDTEYVPYPKLLIEVSTAYAAGFAARSRGIVLAEHNFLTLPVLEAVGQTQQALYVSDARFQNVFDLSAIAMCLTDLNGKPLTANRSLLEMTGYDLDAFLKQTPRHLVAWPTEGTVADIKDLLAARRENVDIETELRRANGPPLQVQLSKTLLYENEGSPRYIITAVEDISERKRSEAVIEQADQRVKELIQNSSDMIAVISREGVIEFVSPSVQHILGYPPESILNKNIGELIVDENRAAFAAILGGRKHRPRQTIRTELRALHRDGSPRWLEAMCTDLTHLAEVRGFVVNVRDITDRKDLQHQLERQASHDSLIGLPNRLAFYEQLERALSEERSADTAVAVLFLDLVRFKTFNEWMGHGGGDETLVAVGQRLSESLKPGELVARLGGDEFAILIEGTTAAAAISRALSIQLAFARPIQVLHRLMSIEARIGIALNSPDLDQVETLLRAADIAHQRAKARDGGATVMFEQRMHEENLRQIELETDLQGALQHQEIEPYFLPAFDLQSGQLVGAEVVMRWHRPNGDITPPDEFLPTAEETGLIGQLGEFGFRSSCHHLRSWLDAGIVSEDFCLSVNLSRLATRLPDLAETIQEILEEHLIPPDRIRFEIPEDVLSSNDDQRRSTLAKLDRLGCKVMIDGFGSGPSSLTLLEVLPVAGLKAARSFHEEVLKIDPEGKLAITLNEIAGRLGIHVTLSGIETEEHLERARAAGFHCGQGDLLSPPLSAREMVTLLSGRSSSPHERAFAELSQSVPVSG